ncbi:P-loop NTPase fold protein [Methylobacter sp. Wu1]|uniref:P-loop NTPase fold protein n=1 Tax=Methylobacter sp. Wu1 TaxID=3119359 RepID=UPI002F939C89
MSYKNRQIEEFLHNYYFMKMPPQYAVMIKGDWGAGKTSFIQRSAEKLKEDDGCALYVSLYGISDTKAIEYELFRQIHPRLAGKNMILAGRIAKGFLKGMLKIDLDGDEKEDGSLSVSIPDIDLPEYLQNINGHVLIFDDIERCSIPIVDLLGYINYFVEHGGHKVVLVVNENEIMKCDTKNEQSESQNSSIKADYKRIKEKLVGKTFEIESDVEGAVSAFIEEIGKGHGRTAIEKNKQLICNLYKASKYQNLRHLRQAILEFDRLMAVISPKFRKNKLLIKDLLSSLLIYITEVRSGNLKPSEISNIRDIIYSGIFTKSKQKSSPTNMNKYNGFVWLDGPLPGKLWADIIGTGLIDAKAVNGAIKNSHYFAREDRPEWRRLWEFYTLSDDEFTLLVNDVAQKFNANQYEDVGILFHVAGILLKLSEFGIYSVSTDDILLKAKANLNELTAAGKVNCFTKIIDPMSPIGWGGLGFTSFDKPEFLALADHLKECVKKATEASLPKAGEELLKEMKTDSEKFARALIVTNGGDNFYYNKPILAHTQPKNFVKTVIENLPDVFRTLAEALKVRYNSNHAVDLIEELDWLRNVICLLDHEIENRNGKISSLQLKHLRDTMSDCIEAFQRVMPSSSEELARSS